MCISYDALSRPKSAGLVATRRDFHAFAEPGWCEFRTASKIVQSLRNSGWQVAWGRSVVAPESRMGVPPEAELRKWFARAREAGAEPAVLRKMEGGFTGVVGVLRAAAPGPVVALRFDIDASPGQESDAPEHPPVRAGFRSHYSEAHHNCGHDGHAALGLAVADALAMMKDQLRGEVRLIFQPAEEGLRGAASMVSANVLKDVDFFFGCHIGAQALGLGEVIVGYENILGSVKLDVRFAGRAAHAALSPHLGRSALLAACTATLSLYAISQHGGGETRVNVGLLRAGTSRNTVAPDAYLAAEVRGETDEIVEYLEVRAIEVLQGCAQTHGVTAEVQKVGGCSPASSSPEAAKIVRRAAQASAVVTRIRDACDFKACDDVAVMMRSVQEHGGMAAYFGLGSPLADGHHTPDFDFDEACLPVGLEVFVNAVVEAIRA